MVNSSLSVFSLIKNVENFVKGKDIEIFKMSNIAYFKRSRKIYIENSKRIYNDIENNYYSQLELVKYLLYRYMFEKYVNPYSIKAKDIKETMKLFAKEKLNEDMELLKEIALEFKFKGVCNFFELKEDGTNIAYILTKNKRISPIFFIKNNNKCLTYYEKNDIIKCKDYERFERIANKIKIIFKGGS